jgi:hypothetical protein
MDGLDQLKDGLEACRIALGVVRDVRDTLPAGKGYRSHRSGDR